MTVEFDNLQRQVNSLNAMTGEVWALSEAGGYAVVRANPKWFNNNLLFKNNGYMSAEELAIRLVAYCQGFEHGRGSK